MIVVCVLVHGVSVPCLPPYSLPSSLYPSVPPSPFCLLTPSLFPLSLPPSLSFLPPYSLLTSLYSLLPPSPVCLLTPSSLPSLLLVATTMVDLGRDKSSVDDYALAMDDILGDFEFPDDFLIDCWKAIETVKAAATT